MKGRWLAVCAYSYSGLHILWWWTLLSSNGSEGWLATLESTARAVFIPLNLVCLGIRLGHFEHLRGEVVLGPVADVAVVSLLSVSVMLVAVMSWRRRRAAR